MQTHIIEKGVVVNTILATVAEAQAAYPDATCIEATDGGIGWTWDGEALHAPSPPVLTPEQVREAAKAARDQAVVRITVTTTAGNTFDGDETSQTRMARAVLVLQATGTPSVNWVLHDNSVIEASAAELAEALARAGAAQAALWVL